MLTDVAGGTAITESDFVSVATTRVFRASVRFAEVGLPSCA